MVLLGVIVGLVEVGGVHDRGQDGVGEEKPVVVAEWYPATKATSTQ